MKYLITEDQDTRIRALRLLNAVDELVDLKLKKPFSFDICHYDKEWVLDHIIESTNEDMFYDYFYPDIDDDTEEWHKIWNIYNDYITTTYAKKIFDFYKRKCGK